ncbi:MAG: hypothetical protein JXM68_01090, partial [Sedimentisphaerales bacterium]|nr:hypothetical protein [Sedimentisphaerales bacterium]
MYISGLKNAFNSIGNTKSCTYGMIQLISILLILASAFTACSRKDLWENETKNSVIADVNMTSAGTADSQITFNWEDPAGTVIQEIRITCTRVSDSTIVQSDILGAGVGTDTISGLSNGEEYSINIVVVDYLGDLSPGVTFSMTPQATAATCYFIYTTDDLDAVRGSALPQYTNWDLADTYNLMADLDLSAYSAGSGWVPLGDNITAFTGTFEGNGHTISNLTILAPTNYQGLFGYID